MNEHLDYLIFVGRHDDVYSIYPSILKQILVCDELMHLKDIGNEIKLPSDLVWQVKMYNRLLDEQKRKNAALRRGETITEECTVKDVRNWVKKDSNICTCDDPSDLIPSDSTNRWKIGDLVKAAKLMRMPSYEVTYKDEIEMKRVLSVMFEAYIYKNILSEVLHNTSFFVVYPELKVDRSRVCLLLLDMYMWNFTMRDDVTPDDQQLLYESADLLYADKCIRSHAIKLAAEIQRIRIKHGVLHLSHLLPEHLKDYRISNSVKNPIIYGWINTYKIVNKTAADAMLYETMHFKEHDDMECKLNLLKYRWDKLCPFFVSCHPENRSDFARCNMVKDHEFIMQTRAFAIGPAIFSNLLDHFDLKGDVVQTHVYSSKSIAYLASLLLNNNRVKHFIVFGCGNRLHEHEEYMRLLGVHNIILHSENFVDIPQSSHVLDNTVGVFVTPPNSYTAIPDPIDLICGRGGDYSMIPILCESAITAESETRVAKVLAEQRDTLKLSMSKPQIQFVLYQTHSNVDTENEQMIATAIEYINKKALNKHKYLIREKFETGAKRKRSHDEENCEGNAEAEKELTVPSTDIFTTVEIPNQDKCWNLKGEGCFLKLITRSEIVRLDSTYMIKIAENRGLFTNEKKAASAKETVSKLHLFSENSTSLDMTTKKKSKNFCNKKIESLCKTTFCSQVREYQTLRRCLSPCEPKCIRCKEHNEKTLELLAAAQFTRNSCLSIPNTVIIQFRSKSEPSLLTRNANASDLNDKASVK